MEVSVIGCMPHVQEKNLVPSDCYENRSFISIAENDGLNKCRKIAHKEKKTFSAVSASKSGVKSANDVSIKLTPQSKDLVQFSSRDHDESLSENKCSEPAEEITLDMRVDSDEVLNPVPVVAESVSHVNGVCSEVDLAADSSSPTLLTVNTSEGESVLVTDADDLPNSDSRANDSPDSPGESSTSDSSQKKKRYLFLFRPSINKILVKSKTNNSYRCYVCGGIYRQKFSLKRHYLRSHVDFRYISEADIANCKIPVPSYHQEEQHSSGESSKKTSNGRKKFKKSSSDVFLENNDSRLMPGLYRCHDCSGVFCNSEMELREHYNKHPDSVKKKFQCHICNASFFKKQILSRHLAGHGEKVIKTLCKRCNIEFLSKAEYQKHLVSHSSGRKCKYCSKILSTSANRKRHEAVHEGLKTFHCAHCNSSFAQRKDLDRHLRKQHTELCHICSLCNKVFPTRDNLTVHVREKHTGSPKSQGNSNKSEDGDRPVIPKSPVIPAAKAKVCHVCKRVFNTVYAMLKHKRNAHPFYSRRRRHKKKEQNVKVSPNFNDCQRSHIKSQKAIKDNSKQMKQPGRPSQKNLTKREKELADERAKLEEIKFYNHVHQNIAENLTNYIDGRPSQLSLKEYNFNDYFSDHFEERRRIPWSDFNFPHWYDVDAALKTKGHEIKRPENMSLEDELLFDATGLTPAHSSANNRGENTVNENSKDSNPDECQQYENLTIEEKKALIGRHIISVIVCYICREKFNSYASFDEHCTNNHPNVECSFVEIEGDKESPPVVPPELCRVDLNSVGFRFSCDVPPQLSGYTMRCTKCFKHFEKGSELHEHVTICGNLMNSSMNYVPRKPNPQRRIKRTMKKRMTLEQQQAALTSSGFRTPEKRESALNLVIKSSEKTSRSEKLQFYKNGRLQTKSLTVDMNYFNTKPQKTVKSVSKRGRKSYAIVSSMYRNATLQPSTLNKAKPPSKRGRKSYAFMSSLFRNSSVQASTSRECCDCGRVFVSIQALNDHIKNSCSRQPLKEQLKLLNPPHNEAESSLYIKNPSYLNASPNRQNRSELLSNSRNFGNPKSCVALPASNHSFRIDHSSKSENRNGHCLNPSKQLFNSGDFEPACAPMDLSKSSNDSRNSNLNPICNNQSNAEVTKSALESAMEAILQFVHSDEFVQKRSVHTPNKQDGIGKNQTAISPLVSPVSKPVAIKKVGRPRKIKKLSTSPPVLPQKNLSPDSAKKNAISKPGRLEEAIKKLTFRSKEKERQKNSTLSDSPVSENKTTLSPGSLILDIPNVTPVQSETCQSNLTSETGKTESITENNVIVQISNSKNNIADRVESDSVPDHGSSKNSSTNADKTSLAGSKMSDIASFQEVLPLNKITVVSLNCDNIMQKENEKDIQGGTVVANFTVGEQSDKLSQSTSAHGRSSPTLESILQVINQKLHSEEQESSQQDDSAIPWLEDEKFEIPPSRTKLNIIVPSSNIELLPAENKNSATTLDQSLKPNVLPPVNIGVVHNEALEQIPESAPLENTALNKNIPTSSVDEMGSVLEKEIHPSSKEVEVPGAQPDATFVDHNVASSNVLENEHMKKPAAKKGIKSPVLFRNISLVPQNKIKSAISPVGRRRRPGRPRKKLVDGAVAATHSDSNEANNNSPSQTEISIPYVPNAINNASSQNDISVNSSTVANNADNVDENLSEAGKESYIEHDDLQTSIPLTTNEPDKLSAIELDKSSNQVENDPLTSVSLRNFRTKSKQTQQNNISSSSCSPAIASSSKTTEFGKNLASRMKEKMRSFDPSKSLAARIEESSISTSADTSDTNSQASNEDNKLIKIVKKEFEAAELTKIHSCPYCMLEFAYLTNFRRHIKKCQTRFESNETEPVPGTPSTHLQHLPKKDEVDYSILNLYRHQSRQTQMMKEVENTNQLIQKYECGVCHRIYLNLFGLMQHKTHHKLLAASSSSEQNIDSASCSEGTDIDNMLSFENDLTSEALQEGNEGNFDDNVEFNSIAESEISENSEKSASVFNGSELTPANIKETDNGLSVETNIVQWPSTESNDECDTRIEKENDTRIEKENDTRIEKENDTRIEKENDTRMEKENDQSSGVSDSPKDVNANDQAQPVKRKRGRPFGWRKTQGNDESKSMSNTVVFKKKVGKLQSMDGKSVLSTKLKASTREIILEKMVKPLRQKLKLMAAKKGDFDSAPRIEQDEKSDAILTESSLSSQEEILKASPKRLFVKIMSDVDKIQTPDSVDVKNTTTEVLSESLEKTEPSSHLSATMELSNSPKRSRGKPGFPSKTPNKSILKADFSPKRRPGRPPKSLLSAPSTSQSIKSSYSQSSSIRNLRKMLPMLKTNDSSDSESEKAKPKISVKRKVNKICALCKEKFVSNLELHRHIQLVHSRRLQPAVIETDSGRTLKKLVPKSPPVNSNTENEGICPTKRDDSPLKKSSNLKVCTICNREFLTYLLLRNHQQIVHQKKFDQLLTYSKKSDIVIKPEQGRRSVPLATKLGPCASTDSSESIVSDSIISVKRNDSPLKKSPNLKVCALCKKRFLNCLLLRSHIQEAHSRKSEPVAMKSDIPGRRTETVVIKSDQLLSLKNKEENMSDRSALSRQCRKPLPLLKRRRVKKEPPEQLAKKPKL